MASTSGTTQSIVCISCNKEFSSKGNLNRHYKTVHAALDAVLEDNESGTIHCLEQDCEYRCRYISGLRKHLVSIHGFKMEEEEVTFRSLEGDLYSRYIYSYIAIYIYIYISTA